ncbi:hypothetical protein [Amnibacterium kyonggiense]|uniref:Uncharacterized protein n=1 Tax=Amnibacterium kyonggiense TaxID=595671 RepID=A0A4R7FRT5_9MICO|nr:hypothetical protein [Amnibacterium kyonggiense]TDS80523.1 hypothetical protein CLV52_1089 [Amnibacterium kyonggiense]
MTTRQFDPVFSAALRNELEALADVEPAPARPHRPVRTALGKPQLWVSLVTAIALAVVTVGVLRLTHESEPAEESRVIPPLSRVTDPANPNYVARSVQTLLTVRGTGPGTHAFDVPASVSGMQVYLDCAPDGHYSLELDSGGLSSGGCDRDVSGNFGIPVTAGTHEITVSVPKATEWALLIIAKPAPTVSTGPLLDPLAAVRDLRNPDALTGDTTPVYRASGERTSAVETVPIPDGVVRLRVYLVCKPSAAAIRVNVDGHVVTGCMNSIAHWFDFTPSSRTITAQVISVTARPWSALIVPAPAGAKDSPENTLLPFPSTQGTDGAGPRVLAQVRGVGNQVVGTLPATKQGIDISVTCRGTGWLEIATAQGTIGRGSDCDVKGRFSTGIGGGPAKRGPYSVTPHGDIAWTATITDAG